MSFTTRPYGITGYPAALDDVVKDRLTDVAGQIITPLSITDPDSGHYCSRVNRGTCKKMKRSADTITTTAGPAEVEVRGSGMPVLVLHGSPGGIDQARAMSQFLTENGFKAVCVSRPGYLGTPLNPAGPSIDHEADLLAAVLDAIGVERAGVLAYSGGGPPAYRLAVRHPGRVSAMVAISAVSSRYVAPRPTAADRFMFGTRAGQWLIGFLARRAPGQLIESALATPRTPHCPAARSS
jgi:pimeloyl-ACP methyl ester carboxylesterase